MVADAYLELRDMILGLDPHARGWRPTSELPNVWGVLVEVGLPEGPATLVALVDGTTSLYLGNGGGTLGAGEVAPVAGAARRLLVTVEAAIPHLPYVWQFPIPGSDRMHLVALTYSGARAAEAALAELVGAGDAAAEPADAAAEPGPQGGSEPASEGPAGPASEGATAHPLASIWAAANHVMAELVRPEAAMAPVDEPGDRPFNVKGREARGGLRTGSPGRQGVSPNGGR